MLFHQLVDDGIAQFFRFLKSPATFLLLMLTNKAKP